MLFNLEYEWGSIPSLTFYSYNEFNFLTPTR